MNLAAGATFSPAALEAHIQKDVAAGLRVPADYQRSLERLPLYQAMDTEKILTDGLTPAQAARAIAKKLEEETT